jgi:hypothetical protein
MTVLGMMVGTLVPLAGFVGFFLADREVRSHGRAKAVKSTPRPAAPPVTPANDVGEPPVAPEGPSLNASRALYAPAMAAGPLVAD